MTPEELAEIEAHPKGLPIPLLNVERLCAEVRRLREERDQAVHAAQANTVELARAWKERDEALKAFGSALAETARLREALDAAQRIVKRKADREAGREET